MNTATLNNGLTVLNTSAHGYTMYDGTIVPGNPELAQVLKSNFSEEVISEENGVKFVQSVAVPTAVGIEWLSNFVQEQPEVLVVTSFANLSAYKHPSLVGFIATAETMRSAPNEKIMRTDKFSQVLK